MILISTQQIPCKLVLNEPLVKLLMICLFPRFRPSVLILVSSICSTQALADVHDVPSRWPTASERSAISAPQYKRPPDGISECLGRLTFELPAKVEWPTATHDSYGSPFNHIFSAKVFDPGDAIEIGSIRVAVMHPADENAKQRIVRNFPANRVMELKKDLAYAQGELRRLEGKVKNSTDEINSVRLQVRDIADIEEAIKSNRVDPVDLGVSESYGYGERVVVANEEHEFSVLHAYLFRGDTIYLFESRTPILSEGDDAAHRLQFRDKVGKFRVRNPHEIPAGPGVCFPSGFLPDDGMTPVDIKLSLRFADARNVLYTIHTGTVTSRTLKSTAMLASARAGLGTFGTYDEEALKHSIAERIGPRAVQIGGVKGEQGGVVARIKMGMEEQKEMYSVFSGYAGWLGVYDVPFMLVDMRTVAGIDAKAKKTVAAPFKRSMYRLDYILKGLRYRWSNANAKAP
jgi:hypothetical protein